MLVVIKEEMRDFSWETLAGRETRGQKSENCFFAFNCFYWLFLSVFLVLVLLFRCLLEKVSWFVFMNI